MFFRLGLTFVLATRFLAGLMAGHIDEYQVKAAFLYNFARFVDWPAEAFRDAGEPFTICVLGDDPFGRALDDVVTGKAISGRPVTVRRVSNPRQTGECRVLFVSSSMGKHALAIPAAAKHANILTVGDAGLAAPEGVIIGFTMENGKVRFEINTDAANRAELHISAKLLSLAKLGGR